MSTKDFENFDPLAWVTQAEAARIRGVSRQAINKLVQKGYLKTVEIGGIVFVKRAELSSYEAKEPGRPYGRNYSDAVKQILGILRNCSAEEKRVVLKHLRKELSIHEIEDKLNIQAEIILEAINQDASGLTFRMLRGVIAEAAFKINVLDNLDEWKDITPKGDLQYDFLVSKQRVEVRIQVKLQRSKNQIAMKANEAYKFLPHDKFVVETQKTRAGINAKTGESTRLYDFDEFDLLAVSLQPATDDWSRFMYIPTRWLLSDRKKPDRLLKFQPVSGSRDQFWTDNLEEAIARLESSERKKINYK